MAVLTSALNAEFTPAAGDFRIQVNATEGTVVLQSRAAGASVFAEEVALSGSQTRLVFCAVAGTVFRFVAGAPAGTVAVRADQ